jgi:hypothetical protein
MHSVAVREAAMPIAVSLIKEGRVALQTYTEPLVMRDLELLSDTMNQDILSPAAGKIHILADFRMMSSPPLFILARGASQLDRSHPNTGTIVAVLENALVYRMGLMFIRLAPKYDIRLARTFDEAVKIIDALLAKDQADSAGER